jgi:hypothetical protein
MWVKRMEVIIMAEEMSTRKIAVFREREIFDVTSTRTARVKQTPVRKVSTSKRLFLNKSNKNCIFTSLCHKNE